jgi:uncharacterized LabA/DUF88 family protein
MRNEDHIALFIDSDNISYHAIEGILNELSKYGIVNIRQAYGNWTKDNLKNWESILLEYAIKPIQQFDYTKNKNEYRKCCHCICAYHIKMSTH